MLGGAEFAGPKNDGPKRLKDGNCRSWKCRTKPSPVQRCQTRVCVQWLDGDKVIVVQSLPFKWVTYIIIFWPTISHSELPRLFTQKVLHIIAQSQPFTTFWHGVWKMEVCPRYNVITHIACHVHGRKYCVSVVRILKVSVSLHYRREHQHMYSVSYAATQTL